jgi:TolB protein
MVMNADGSDPRVILTPKLDMMGSLSWSPDGVSIAFNAYTKNTKWDIYRVGIDGSGLTNLTADMARNTADPDWSPDGKHIVFVHGGNGYPTDLWLMDADGSNRINLTNDDEGQYYPAWSPDGRTILFARDGAGFNKEELVTMPATGGATTPVIAIGIWGRWSPDGRRIVFAGVDGGIFRVNVDGTSLTALDENRDAHTPDW